jgi:predicted dehydrogenase
MIGIAIIGCGGIALANHMPGIALRPDAAKLVAVCDNNPAVVEAAKQRTGVTLGFTDYSELLKRDDVNAVVVATPNYLHAPIAIAAAKAGKHVLVEKPLALNLPEAMSMYQAAEKAGVRHMTAFTYRFVPAMRYMVQLMKDGYVGRPYHFRAQRFQDWGQRPIGWRQVQKLTGTGEIGDMLAHRIDYGNFLIGPIKRLVADMKIFLPERQGQPANVDDWVAMMTEYRNGVTGVLESSKLVSGVGEDRRGRDVAEVNGTDGSIVYTTQKPLEIQLGKVGELELKTVKIPKEFLKLPTSPRDPAEGDPVVTFRWDQSVEFIDAIVEKRPCRPSFRDGCRVQAVIDAAVLSTEQRKWVDVPMIEGPADRPVVA